MILGAIVLIGVALLNQAANCQASKYGSLEEFAKSPDNQGLDTDQVRQLLLRGNRGDKIGEATVEELLKLDNIKIHHCNMVDFDICENVEGDKDLARFCRNRLDELAKFCAERLDQVIGAELKMVMRKDIRRSFQAYVDKATKEIANGPLKDSRKILRGLIDKSDYNDPYQYCPSFLNSMKLAEAILERSGEKFVSLALHNDSLFDHFVSYELCQACKEIHPELFDPIKA